MGQDYRVNMKNLIVCGLVVCMFGVGANAAKFPEYFTKCKKGSGSGACVVQNGLAAVTTLAKDGDSKYKLQSLTPIHVSKIDLQATPQLKVVLEDVAFFGFEDIQFLDGEIDDKQLHFTAKMKRMELVGKYDINGRILILPIQGKGTCNITLVDYDVDYKAKLVSEERKGKTYYHVENDENSVLTINNLKRVYWKFDNLFNGDPRLGPEMNRFLNENWEDVYSEVRQAMEQTAAYSIVNYYINGYLRHIPADELFEA